MEKKINYLQRNFDGIKEELLKFSNQYYPEIFDDFNDSSIGNCSSSKAMVKEPHLMKGTSSSSTSFGYFALPKTLNLAFNVPGSGS